MMAGRRSFFIAALLFLASFCAGVLSDANGNISVEVTRLDRTYSFIVLAVVGVVVVVALFFSALLLAKRSPAARPVAVERKVRDTGRADISIRGDAGSGSRGDGYYRAVFRKPIPEISDEKSRVMTGSAGTSGPSGVDRYLKEDERIVINVLRMKHNSCSQATLRVVTDFSKAKLSRLLSELEARGVVFREAQGRKNIVTLRQ